MPEDMNIEQVELGKAPDGSLPRPGFTEKTQAYLDQHFKSDTLARHIADLTTVGFKNPVTSIERFPQLAGLDIQRVITDLTTAGFKNPVTSIERFPPLAGLDIQRVKRRLELIRRLNRQFKLDYDPIVVIETFPRYLSYSKDRLFFFLRVASFYNIPENAYRSLIFLNPFLVFGELLERRPDRAEGIKGIPNTIRKLSKQEKNERVEEVKAALPNTEIMLEGYPEHQKRFFLQLATNLQRQIERGEKRGQKRETISHGS